MELIVATRDCDDGVRNVATLPFGSVHNVTQYARRQNFGGHVAASKTAFNVRQSEPSLQAIKHLPRATCPVVMGRFANRDLIAIAPQHIAERLAGTVSESELWATHAVPT